MANLPATNSTEGVLDNDRERYTRKQTHLGNGLGDAEEDDMERLRKRRRIRKQLWCGCCCDDEEQMVVVADAEQCPFLCACTWCGCPDEKGLRRCRVRLAFRILALCEDCRDGSCCPKVQNVPSTNPSPGTRASTTAGALSAARGTE